MTSDELKELRQAVADIKQLDVKTRCVFDLLIQHLATLNDQVTQLAVPPTTKKGQTTNGN